MTSPYPVPSFIFVNLPLSHLRGEEGQEDKERLGISEGVVRSGVVLEKDSFVKVKCVAEHRHPPLSKYVGSTKEGDPFAAESRYRLWVKGQPHPLKQMF